jgi:hypothetical protein
MSIWPNLFRERMSQVCSETLRANAKLETSSGKQTSIINSYRAFTTFIEHA